MTRVKRFFLSTLSLLLAAAMLAACGTQAELPDTTQTDKQSSMTDTAPNTEQNLPTYTVSFAENGEQVKNLPAAQSVKEGSCAEQPSAPSRDGYLFGGWYAESACETKYDFTTPITADTTIYPLWRADTLDYTEIGELYVPELKAEDIATDEESGIMYVSGQIIVTAEDESSHEAFVDMIGGYGGQIVGRIEITNDYLVAFTEKITLEDLNALAAQIQREASVSKTYVNYVAKLSDTDLPTDAEWNNEQKVKWSNDDIIPDGTQDTWDSVVNAHGDNWNVEAANMPEAGAYNDEMSTIKIGIIDSGFDTQHNDLPQVEAAFENAVSDHGTHVAGIIAPKWNNDGIAGIVKHAELYVHTIPRADNAGKMQSLYAFNAMLVKLVIYNAKVINVSQGWNFTLTNAQTQENKNFLQAEADLLTETINDLLNRGYDFLIVQAAGNDSNRICGEDQNAVEQGWSDAYWNGIFTNITASPARDHILVVGAHDYVYDAETDTTKYPIAALSNIGDLVDIMAPGMMILSTTPNQSYGVMAGTSMAAPHVTGAAAMVWSLNPYLSGKEVKDILLTSATRTVTVDTYAKFFNRLTNGFYETIDPNLTDRVFTYPMLDAGAAVKVAYEDLQKGYLVVHTIEEEVGTAVAGAKITIYNDNNTFRFEATADEKGRIKTIIGIPDGITACNVKIEARGYETLVLEAQNVLHHGMDLGDIALVKSQFVDSGSFGNGLTWTFDAQDTLTISGSGDMPDLYPELAAGILPWMDHYDAIRRLVITEGITSVSGHIFSAMPALQSISIAGSVTSIGANTFAYCKKLSEVNLAEGLVIINGSAFLECTALTSIKIPASVKMIETRAFSDCESLDAVYFYGDLPTMEWFTFDGCPVTLYYTSGSAGWSSPTIRINGIEKYDTATFEP